MQPPGGVPSSLLVYTLALWQVFRLGTRRIFHRLRRVPSPGIFPSDSPRPAGTNAVAKLPYGSGDCSGISPDSGGIPPLPSAQTSYIIYHSGGIVNLLFPQRY